MTLKCRNGYGKRESFISSWLNVSQITIYFLLLIFKVDHSAKGIRKVVVVNEKII